MARRDEDRIALIAREMSARPTAVRRAAAPAPDPRAAMDAADGSVDVLDLVHMRLQMLGVLLHTHLARDANIAATVRAREAAIAAAQSDGEARNASTNADRAAR